MRPKGEPAIRTVQGHAHLCRPCPTMTGASNKSRENRFDLPGFLRKPEQISRFSRHRAPDGATASHAHGRDHHGHAPKERPPWIGEVDFAERRIGSLRAEKAPPRRSGNSTRPSCPNFSDDSPRNSDAPGGASRVSGEIYQTARQATKTVCTDGCKRPRSDIEKPLERSFYEPHTGRKKTCRISGRQAVTCKSPFNAH